MARAVTGWALGKGEAGTWVLGKKEVETWALGKKEVETGHGQLGLRSEERL